MSVETFELRPYQQETIDDLYRLWGIGWQRIVGVMPTGGGKTVLGVKPVADCIAAGRRVLWLAHRTELIDAAEEKLKADTSGLSVGVLQGRRREFDRHVIVGSVATVVRPAALGMLAALGIGLIVVDECHHSAAPSYMTILRGLGAFEPDGPRVLGLTATLGRADGLSLGEVWEAVAKPIEMQRLIDEGWLLRPRGIRVKIDELNLRGLKSTASQAQTDRAYSEAMSDSLAPAAIARSVAEHCRGRKGVAFLPSVELSKEQARVFCEHGISAVHIDADTPADVRKELMKRARAGAYDVVCNVGLFTEGTDVPIWSFAVLGRMTSSEVLFTQMIGRPLRPYPGQVDALLLDVVGVTARHRIRAIVDLDGAPAVDDIPDDLLDLLDAKEEQAERGDDEQPDGTPLVNHVDGPLVVELVDLFSASHTAWQQSPRGVWFLPTGGGRAVFLAPGDEPGTYDVRMTDGTATTTERTGDPLDAAMTWGERAAKEHAERPVERGAKWRQRPASLADKWAALSAGGRPDEIGRQFGGVRDVLDRRWAVEAIDTLACVEGVTPAGYWTTY